MTWINPLTGNIKIGNYQIITVQGARNPDTHRIFSIYSHYERRSHRLTDWCSLWHTIVVVVKMRLNYTVLFSRPLRRCHPRYLRMSFAEHRVEANVCFVRRVDICVGAGHTFRSQFWPKTKAFNFIAISLQSNFVVLNESRCVEWNSLDSSSHKSTMLQSMVYDGTS